MITGGLTGDLLGAWYGAQAASRQASLGVKPPSVPGKGSERDASVLPPWDPRGEVAALDALKRSVLGNGKFFDKSFGEFANLNVDNDEKSLFAMYQGLRRLQSLAVAASERNVNAFDQMFWDKKFQEGLEQMDGFFAGLEMDALSVLKGKDLSRAQSELVVSRGVSEYSTGVIHRGAFDAEVAAFAGDARFDIVVRKHGEDIRIAIDLDDLGDQPRTLDNVVGHINARLEDNEILTRFSRERIGEPNEFGIIPGNNWGMKISGILTEQISFDAPAGAPAVYIAGVSGTGDNAGGQLSKIVDLHGDPRTVFARRIEADPSLSEVPIFGSDETRQTAASNPLTIQDIAHSLDGGIYVVGKTNSAVDGQQIKGDSDLVLIRYDSNGKEVWTRTLGAANEANGASVAVDSDGNVIVAGSVRGRLGGSAEAGGQDSLVVKFGADGVEQWAQRFGGAGDDRANAVTVGDDGTIYVIGEARGGFGGMANHGMLDGYVRAIGADGQTLYTRSVEGGEGIERAQAVAMAADGGLIIASEVDGRAVLTKFAPGDDGAGDPVWSHDLGHLNGGRIGGLAVGEDGAIHLVGGAGAGFAPSDPLNPNSGGRDAFLVRLSDGAQPSVDYTTFLGSDADDIASGVTVEGGQVYVTGATSGGVAGSDMQGQRNSFVAGFDAATGQMDWSQQIGGRNGVSEAAGIIVDPKGDSVLDRLGLPDGRVTYADSRVVTAQSSLREGDHFFISVDGRRPRKIEIGPNETMRSLTFKLNAVLMLNGNSAVGRVSGGEILRIDPREGVKIELFAGDDGQDALQGLGLPEGVLTGRKPGASRTRDETSAAPPVVALDLPARMSIASRQGAQEVADALQSAIETVQKAWRDLTQDPALKDLLNGPGAGRRGGTVPPHMQAQLANYQAGLDRLMAGAPAGAGFGLF